MAHILRQILNQCGNNEKIFLIFFLRKYFSECTSGFMQVIGDSYDCYF